MFAAAWFAGRMFRAGLPMHGQPPQCRTPPRRVRQAGARRGAGLLRCAARRRKPAMRIAILLAAAVASAAATEARAADPLTVLVTGANRGIGLEYARQLAAQGHTVIGTARDPAAATELRAITDRIEALDVADAASVAALARRLDGVAIDILVNNAGVISRDDNDLASVDFEEMQRAFEVNAFGPLRVTQALMPNLKLGQRKLIVNMSSQLGSIERSNGQMYAYRASKTALNQFSKILAVELGPQGFVVVALHPGWVRTDMGGANATLAPEDSVAGLLALIGKLGPQDNGRFYDYQGKPIPW
jgi:NAD(P)-dependent dehydrogenase (short-subunit alcohol dehydrogenase family)